MNIMKIVKRLRPSYSIMRKLGHTPGQILMPNDLAVILSDREIFTKDERKWAKSHCADAVAFLGHVTALAKEVEDRALLVMCGAAD
ncbi:MAG: hypothetical protein JKX93_08210 [Rhizobiaceae bacterium]|nr:hypothetical protein [Rhizobiaceae bacterium]